MFAGHFPLLLYHGKAPIATAKVIRDGYAKKRESLKPQ